MATIVLIVVVVFVVLWLRHAEHLQAQRLAEVRKKAADLQRQHERSKTQPTKVSKRIVGYTVATPRKPLPPAPAPKRYSSSSPSPTPVYSQDTSNNDDLILAGVLLGSIADSSPAPAPDPEPFRSSGGGDYGGGGASSSWDSSSSSSCSSDSYSSSDSSSSCDSGSSSSSD